MPLTRTSLARTTVALAAIALSCALPGCKARELGSSFSDKQATSVDNSWLIVAGTCWPDMMHSGYSLAGVKSYLEDPLHFRATFPTYAAFTDSALRDLITKPVASAPQGDTDMFSHTSNRVLTRDQAIAGKVNDGVLPADTNNIAPADSFCAVQKGLPAGFR